MYNIQITNVYLDNAKAIIKVFSKLSIYSEEYEEYAIFNLLAENLSYTELIEITNYINDHWDRNDFYEIIIK